MVARDTPPYTVLDGATSALHHLIVTSRSQVPTEFLAYTKNVTFNPNTSGEGEGCFPCPLKEQEAVAAIKALEACGAAAIADLRYGTPDSSRSIAVDLDRVACFLMSAYITTVNGMDKQTPGIQAKLPETDLNQAQSFLYRRLSANLYETSTPGEYYHIHGSLEASTTLSMLGLPTHRPDLTEYRDCINTIEDRVRQFSVAELEELNLHNQQAGIPALTREDFLLTSHGLVLSQLPPLTLTRLQDSSPPPTNSTRVQNNHGRGSGNVPLDYPTPTIRGALDGIKVLELCRVIAGPTIGRSLAAHGASVLKITSPNLPDVPFFQVDVNTGKNCCSLDLREPSDKRNFLALLADADVVIDGYRPGALARLGVGADNLARIGADRGRGYVYVAEDCFGGTGLESHVDSEEMENLNWKGRPGWQQIADCVTGVAWAQGSFMGLNEPIVPPFPMSDYGTGSLGAVAALAGLWRREKEGGSWACRTSLCQYDLFVMSLGLHSDEVQSRLRKQHDEDFFGLRHHDSVDEVGRRALRTLKRVHPRLFSDELMTEAWSAGFGAQIRWPKEAVHIQGIQVAHVRPSRPNGVDEARWRDWETHSSLNGK